VPCNLQRATDTRQKQQQQRNEPPTEQTMAERLRQRGWSIQSSDQETQRTRAESTATEPSLSHDEKIALMNSAFENVDDVEIVLPPAAAGNIEHGGSNEESDYLDMFGEEEGDDEKNPKKRRKIEPSRSEGTVNYDEGDRDTKEAKTQRVVLTKEQQDNLDLARSKLSKW
jgi:hypothetical protein